MAVKIRLTRKGKKKQPTYRVVVADERSPRDGRYIEQIGRYDPRQEPSIVEIENDRASYWLSVGAQPSDAVRKLLEISGVLESRPVKIKDSKVHVVDEVAQAGDAADDETVIEAAATEEPDTAEVDATAVDEVVDAGDATDDDESLLDKAEDAISAAAPEAADVVEDVVDQITGEDGGDAAEAAAEEEESS